MHVEIKRICTPTDFSEPAEHALQYGVALADKFEAELHLLHVLHDFAEYVTHPDFTAHNELAREYFEQLEWGPAEREGVASKKDEAEDEATEEFLRSLQREVTEQFEKIPRDAWWERLNICRAVRYGNPVVEICNYARKQAIDLLVLGTHGRTGLQHLLVGSVAERVVRAAPCPVLSVRPLEREFIRED